MKTLTFSFRAGVSTERQAEILHWLASRDGVSAAGKVKPESPRAAVARMAYVRVSDEADATILMRQLADSPEIETPAEAPARRLVSR